MSIKAVRAIVREVSDDSNVHSREERRQLLQLGKLAEQSIERDPITIELILDSLEKDEDQALRDWAAATTGALGMIGAVLSGYEPPDPPSWLLPPPEVLLAPVR